MAQNYLQLKMQSNKQLAIALTNSLRDMHEDHMATLEKVKQGTQRLLSYGACLMPDEYYRNACRDTWREDKRLVLALGEIYNRKDVTLDMVEIYFRKTLNRLGEQKSKDLIANIHNLYQALYKENIEMLYFLIEPQMSEIIYQVNSGDNNEQVIGDALCEILRK